MIKKLTTLIAISVFSAVAVNAAPGDKAPDRDRGDGPYDRLILRGGILVNGEGAPPRGPVDIVIEDDRIVSIHNVGYPGTPILVEDRPKANKGDKEIDVHGHYLLPGFVDMHGHIGNSADNIPAEYVLKLWLAHGITTVREPGSFAGPEWTMYHVERAKDNRIASPRIVPYFGFGMGYGKPITTPQQAREWVKSIVPQGAKGIKFFGARPEIMRAAIDEAKQHGLGTMMHHAQLEVADMNVLVSSNLGLDTMEHWYGLPESMFEDKHIQHYPAEYNYQNEQHRFGEAGKLWQQATPPGSELWNDTIDALKANNFTLNPTFSIYDASRDLTRAMHLPWHQEYTLPTLWEFFQPSRRAHGSYWFDWTTANELEWKQNYNRWMQFVNDYKNAGGRVTTGSDSGYIFSIYGFGFVRELEMLQEAGFHPLEVLRSATFNGAEVLGMQDDIGSLRPGKKADIVVVRENPLANFKTLYATGTFKLNDEGKPHNTEGIRYTIKDGIVYDVVELKKDVKAIVEKAKSDKK